MTIESTPARRNVYTRISTGVGDIRMSPEARGSVEAYLADSLSLVVIDSLIKYTGRPEVNSEKYRYCLTGGLFESLGYLHLRDRLESESAGLTTVLPPAVTFDICAAMFPERRVEVFYDLNRALERTIVPDAWILVKGTKAELVNGVWQEVEVWEIRKVAEYTARDNGLPNDWLASRASMHRRNLRERFNQIPPSEVKRITGLTEPVVVRDDIKLTTEVVMPGPKTNRGDDFHPVSRKELSRVVGVLMRVREDIVREKI